MRKAIDVPGIDFVETRTKPYYNKYLYKIRVKLYGLGILWDILDVSSFREKLDNINSLKTNVQLQKNRLNLEKFIEWKFGEERKGKCSIRIDRNAACVFSNDLNYLKEVSDLFEDCDVIFVMVEVMHSAGVMYFKRKPKNNFRVYLQYTRVSNDECKNFIKYIKTKSGFNPSYSFSRWMDRAAKGTSYGVHSSFFFDLDDEKDIFVILLKYSNIIGKHFKLEQRPEVE